MNYLRKDKNDTTSFDVILMDKWKKYNKDLWYNPTPSLYDNTTVVEEYNYNHEMVDLITIQKFSQSLNWKGTGTNNIAMELFILLNQYSILY